MKPITFKECNSEFAKNQKQYKTLPAYYDNGKEGHVVTCWKLSFKERIRILFKGKVWMSLMTFKNPLQPSLLSSKKSDILITK